MGASKGPPSPPARSDAPRRSRGAPRVRVTCPWASKGPGARTSRRGQGGGEGLGRELDAVREERHGVVEADQRDRLEDLLEAEGRGQFLPEPIGDRGRVVQLVDEADQA